jgi:hypothetical protein
VKCFFCASDCYIIIEKSSIWLVATLVFDEFASEKEKRYKHCWEGSRHFRASSGSSRNLCLHGDKADA